jgi:hypothetical protein
VIRENEDRGVACPPHANDVLVRNLGIDVQTIPGAPPPSEANDHQDDAAGCRRHEEGAGCAHPSVLTFAKQDPRCDCAQHQQGRSSQDNR